MNFRSILPSLSILAILSTCSSASGASGMPDEMVPRYRTWSFMQAIAVYSYTINKQRVYSEYVPGEAQDVQQEFEIEAGIFPSKNGRSDKLFWQVTEHEYDDGSVRKRAGKPTYKILTDIPVYEDSLIGKREYCFGKTNRGRPDITLHSFKPMGALVPVVLEDCYNRLVDRVGCWPLDYENNHKEEITPVQYLRYLGHKKTHPDASPIGFFKPLLKNEQPKGVRTSDTGSTVTSTTAEKPTEPAATYYCSIV